MFTGLVEARGRVIRVSPRGRGAELAVDVSGLREAPDSGASIAVDGVCLTVTKREGAVASFDAVSETIRRSTLGSLRPGDAVNLESALRAGDPLDGHMVLGHVDAVGTLAAVRELPQSSVFRFSMPAAVAPLVAEKGSIAVAGVSLTVAEAGRDFFAVSLIPETLRRTTLGGLAAGAKVNLEADVLARYIARQREFSAEAPAISEERLRAFMRGTA